MAVLSRNNYVGQQRLDLADLLASESFAAFDFRAVVSQFVGINTAYVMRGLEVVGKTGLTIQVRVADALTFNPQDGNGSFYLGLPDDADFGLALPANQSNIYIEAIYTNTSTAPISKAFWDPLALTGDTSSGTEFSAATNSQVITKLSITANTIGFTEGAIPLARASTNASTVTSLTDCRPLMYRLGTGGNSPDQLAKYGWSTSRGESVISGPGVGDAVDSSWRARDSVGALNDKGIRNQKEWMDAVMTRIAEIAGTSLWYQTASSSGSASNTSVSQLFFDTLGSHIQPSANASLIWKRVTGNLVLASEGFLSGGPHQDALVKWRSNNSGLQWQVGGTFVNDTPGGSRSYSAGNYKFTSPAPADNGNIYLALEREVLKGSGANLSWKDNSAYAGFLAGSSVSGVPGDFTGIAIGDYIRKESEGYSRYYRVNKFYNGAEVSTENAIADSSAVCLELVNLTNPAAGISGSASSEPLRYFRSRYSSADIVADETLNTYNFQDANFSWIGRRVGSLFILKDYGNMQEGEEVPLLNDAFQVGGGMSDITLSHAKQAYYDPSAGYALKTGSGTLLTIYRRKQDNTFETPASGDNSGSLLTFTITAPVGALSTGQQLWVRLSDDTSGTLAPGSVTSATSDVQNQDVTPNVYEIRDASTSPVRTYDNRNVFLLARKETVDGIETVVFFDGSTLGAYGLQLTQNVEVRGNLKIQQPSLAVPFISDSIAGQIDTDLTNFFYNKPSNIFGFQNFRANGSNLSLGTVADANFLPNLGAHTVTIGGASSTTYIPGDLIVAGNTIAAQVSELMVEDKLITLAIGDALNGGFNSGIEIADDTRSATTLSTVNTSPNVTITFVSSLPYLTGDVIGVSSTDTIGGLTAGQISGRYTIVTSLTAAGQATVSGTTLVIRTAGAATSTVSGQAAVSTKVYAPQWFVKVTGADGTLTGTTSWAFGIKNFGQPMTLTAVTGYYTVPTANSVNMTQTRVPFVNDDNAGPSGRDSTLNFSGSFTFDNGTNTLTVTNITSSGTYTVGTLAVTGNATIGGTLGVTGATTLSSLGVTGNETVGGTLGVTGATTLSSLGVTGNETVGGTLGVTGATTLSSLGVTGNETVGGTLGVTGATTLSSVGISGNATIGGTLGVTGLSTLGSLGVTAGTTLGGTLDVTGVATFNSTVVFKGGLYQNVSNFTSNYTVTATDSVIVGDTTSAVADVTVSLPTVAGAAQVGRVLTIKDGGGTCSTTNKRIILDASGSETIDGQLTFIMENDFSSITLVATAVGKWSII